METNNQNSAVYEWGTFPFRDEERILDIRYDPVFKAVFTKDTSASRCALSKLISALIRHNVSVEAIIANEPPIDDLRQRYLRFDVVCRTKEGELVIVEMSFNPNAGEQVRLEYHVARLFVGQGIHGEGKTFYDLKETYQIAILAKYQFFPDEELIHDFLYYDPKTHVSLCGKTRIITIELVKTEPVVEKSVKEMTNAELWAVFFQYLTDKEKRDKIIEIINHEEGIAMAVETLSNITQDEIEYFRLSNLIKSELDWRTGIFEAENKGRNEEKLENARKMKTMGFLTEQIQAVTGLSMETIAQL